MSTTRVDTADSMCKLKSLRTSAPLGIRTERGNPDQPAISLEKERGGIKIKINDTAPSGQHTSNNQSPNTDSGTPTELANYCDDALSNCSDAYSLISDVPSLISAPSLPTPPSDTDDVLVIMSKTPLPLNYPEDIEAHLNDLCIDQSFPPPNTYLGDLDVGEQEYTLAAHLLVPNDNPMPEEAISGLDCTKWLEAMHEEIANLEKRETFERVERLNNKNIIGCKWVLTVKRNETGDISRYKAHHIVPGFSQKPGQDFDETFAPVVRLKSVRTLVAIASQNDWDISQLDVTSAYLHADVKEELYIRRIPYFNDGSDHVLCLRRSLYGLKQASRMWNRMFNTKLKALGYSPCLTDTCEYPCILNLSGKLFVAIIAIHVDDSIVISTPNHTAFVVGALLHEFEMHNLGPIQHFLGMHFRRYRERGFLVINQTAYIESIVELAGLKDPYPADTPLSPTTQLTRHAGVKPTYPYAAMIGKILYVAICTRPDIAYAASFLSQFISCYGPVHVTAIKRVIQYLKGTALMGIVYKRSAEGFGEVGYSDADWGRNLLDRKSISGYVFMLGAAAVAWSAKKQPTFALSTMEAEYIAMAYACTQALWFCQFFEELRYLADAPTLLLSDNLAALTLSVESQFHGRSKHINIHHHFMRDIIKKQKVTTLYVLSAENLADAFTKPLPASQFNYLMNSIMGEQIFEDEELD